MVSRLGVDVGGTFTDFLLYNEQTGHLHLTKVPSTPSDQSVGVLTGILKIAIGDCTEMSLLESGC